ncbi:MAG: DUF262 domain-containing protein, partial [Desulfovibrionaceae bacterium]|nr:DUF262 domain-containing protein [Desulfovibrionaceae bacterium]
MSEIKTPMKIQPLPTMNIQSLLEYQLSIPDYQRAYSWGETQYKQFWNDILEYLEYSRSLESTHYFIGHILLEKKTNSESYDVIDGQQRITTVIILLNILQKLLDEENVPYSPLSIKNFSISLHPHDFHSVILQSPLSALSESQAKTKSSQIKNCIKAHNYFLDILRNHEDKIREVHRLILEAECTIQIIENRLDAIRRFISENNRGKDVNSLELFKTLCLYHLYLNDDEYQRNICYRIFGEIYSTLDRLENYQDTTLLKDTYQFYYNTPYYNNP